MIVIPGSVVRRTAALALVGVVALAPAASADPGDPVDLGGTPVKSTTDAGNPTMLKAGLWSTTLKAGESLERQFAYRRTADDTSVHVSVTATPAESSESIKLEAFADDGTSCGSETASASYATPSTAIGVDLEVGPDGHGDRNSVCLTSTVIRFEVGPNTDTRTGTSDLPMTIKVVEESPLADANERLPEVPETEASFRAPADGVDRGTIEGATSFDEAPLLKSGTYDSTVTEGEQRLYRVHLEWGQTLAAALHVEALSGKDLEKKFGISGPTLYLGLYNPMRRDLDSAYSDSDVDGSVDDTALDLDTGVGPVRYLNRYDDQNTYLPGDYYVSVVVPEETASERGPAEIGFALTVEAQGDIAGAPTYAEDQPFLVGDGKRSEVASGNPAPGPDDAGWLSARHVSGLGIGLAGLVCLALGALRLRRP
ncbi:hypothetical protein [Nocardioides sp. Soil796]|uniref:hypothetical protein n=1 Tax=Nocardioides sp. Soil796 TaxID=1736412 RepID=UPI00070CCBF8|nr:hypothetical protein [Nocardioides sp. Soil796]KRF19612.1 hypothetical protein ASH02_23935 [Nocardioides sp. Soil796]